MVQPSPGRQFRSALLHENPLQIVGAINALCAMQAERAGFRALYLSGAGVANASHGLPDLGITSLNDVVTDAARITAASALPLLVDIDTGWGTELTIRRAIRELERVGVAGVHMEDQVAAKRCGHRPGKQLVDSEEMQARIQAAVRSRRDPDFVVMARTDAVAVEGIEAAIVRAGAYVSAGADMIFAEAIESLQDYRRFTQSIAVPVLANMTEFGRTPYFTLDEFRACGIQMVLYPLTGMRAMNHAVRVAYETLRSDGTQKAFLNSLQTRDQLYDLLQYHASEKKLDQDNNRHEQS
ncbi:MAG: methylisocitrate lyase [Pirellula sp.]